VRYLKEIRSWGIYVDSWKNLVRIGTANGANSSNALCKNLRVFLFSFSKMSFWGAFK
jgi:hypothetical protein